MSHSQVPRTPSSGAQRELPSPGPVLVCGAVGLGLGLLLGWFEAQGITTTATQVNPKDPVDGLPFIFYGFGLLGAGAGVLLGILLAVWRRQAP